MTTDQKINSLAKILKRITEEKLEREKAILKNLTQKEKNIAVGGFLVNEESVKEEKKKLSTLAKDQTTVVDILSKELATIEKCLTEK